MQIHVRTNMYDTLTHMHTHTHTHTQTLVYTHTLTVNKTHTNQLKIRGPAGGGAKLISFDVY